MTGLGRCSSAPPAPGSRPPSPPGRPAGRRLPAAQARPGPGLLRARRVPDRRPAGAAPVAAASRRSGCGWPAPPEQIRAGIVVADGRLWLASPPLSPSRTMTWTGSVAGVDLGSSPDAVVTETAGVLVSGGHGAPTAPCSSMVSSPGRPRPHAGYRGPGSAGRGAGAGSGWVRRAERAIAAASIRPASGGQAGDRLRRPRPGRDLVVGDARASPTRTPGGCRTSGCGRAPHPPAPSLARPGCASRDRGVAGG